MAILIPPKSPNLPAAPIGYSQQHVDQLSNVLRLYFNQIENSLAQLVAISSTALPVDMGGTGVTSFVSNQSLWGNGTNPIDDDAGFTRTTAGGRYLFGATDDGSSKLQVQGNGRIASILFDEDGGNSDRAIVATGVLSGLSAGLTMMSADSVSSGVGGGTLNMIAGAGLGSGSGGQVNLGSGFGGATGAGGDFTQASGSGGATSGNSGNIFRTIGSVTDGDAGALVDFGADGSGTDKSGSSYQILLGNKTGAGIDGIILITDNAGSGTLIYAPVGDLLTVGTVQANYNSSDASPGIDTTITTASLIGKTITVKDGLITGFA